MAWEILGNLGRWGNLTDLMESARLTGLYHIHFLSLSCCFIGFAMLASCVDMHVTCTHADRLRVSVAFTPNPMTCRAGMAINGLVRVTGSNPIKHLCLRNLLWRQNLAGRANYCSIHLPRALLSACVDDSYVAL